MEEKIMTILVEMQKQINGVLEKVEKVSNRVDVLSDQVEKISNRVDVLSDQVEKISNRVDMLTDQVEKMSNRIDELSDQVDRVSNRVVALSDRLEKVSEKVDEVFDQQFVFEHEYGMKIDVIVDAVKMELDKNLEKSEKIRELASRMDRNEVSIFAHEERISTLELKQG